MNKEIIKTDFKTTIEGLIKVVSSFNKEQFNSIPFQNSWTAGQVVDHIIKSIAGFAQILKEPGKETKRKPNDKIEQLKKAFSKKMKSPEFLTPEDKQYNKEEVLHIIQNIKMAIEQTIDTVDLTKTCANLELPVYGSLTKLEAIYFAIYHIQRHTHQLKHIAEKLIHINKVKQI